ncbi:hypothetical protein CGCFRS4_v011704 [Colletotrichum fructicola]|nr:hypothetical protein CGCFRS4_v011704 [Colletotrichum fructicola]
MHAATASASTLMAAIAA